VPLCLATTMDNSNSGDIVKNKYPVKNIVHRGHKQHLIRHTVQVALEMYYCPLKIYDTQRSEKWHMVNLNMIHNVLHIVLDLEEKQLS